MEFFACAAYVFFIGIGSNLLGQMLPRKWFDPQNGLFRCRDWELDGKIYEKCNVRKWKDKLPDLSRVVKWMYPKAVTPNPDSYNLTRVIEETCVAEFTHLALILLSLGVLWIWKGTGGRIIWLLCVLGNLPFIIIQRFNRPRLLAVLERLQSKQAVV